MNGKKEKSPWSCSILWDKQARKKTETAIINPILKMEKLDSNLEWYLAKPK